MYPFGTIKLVDLTLGNDVANTELWRPPVGFEWLHIQTLAQHNNVANSAIYWEYYEPETGKAVYIYGGTVPTNGNVFCERASTKAFDLPLKSTHDVFIRARFTPEAGKRLIVRGFYIERPEDFDLALMEMMANYMGYKLPIASRE